jgi:cytoskeleton protein RodZ
VPNALIDPLSALEIKLREDTWVEISNQNGVKLISRLMRAGTTEKFEIKEPVVLVVGNATGVDVRLRGQTLNLKAGARDNVAKLNIK